MIDVNELEFKKFPGGELHLTDKWYTDINLILSGALRYNDLNNVICRIQNSDDFMKLALFTNAFKSIYGSLPNLTLPYIPYARQDRIPSKGESLSIKVFANLLNSLEYPSVTVFDPHSDVCTALIENVNIITQWELWGSFLSKLVNERALDKFDLISPDSGALKKIYNLQTYLGVNRSNNLRIGMKHRDTETGQITGTTIDGGPRNKTAIIIDDICDGGRTFIELCKAIRSQYDNVILCVTHGIFSKGIDVLSDFDRIYCYDTWGKIESKNNLTVLPINNL